MQLEHTVNEIMKESIEAALEKEMTRLGSDVTSRDVKAIFLAGVQAGMDIVVKSYKATAQET